jgi:hypothetical protein
MVLGILLAGACGAFLARPLLLQPPVQNNISRKRGGATVRVLDVDDNPLLSMSELQTVLADVSVDHLFIVPFMVKTDEFIFTKHDNLFAYSRSIGKFKDNITRTLNWHYRNLFSLKEPPDFDDLQYVVLHYNNNSVIIYVIHKDTLQVSDKAQAFHCVTEVNDFHSFAARDHNLLANKVLQVLENANIVSDVALCEATEAPKPMASKPKPSHMPMKLNEDNYVKLYIMSYVLDEKVKGTLEKFATTFESQAKPQLEQFGVRYQRPKDVDNYHFTLFHVCVHRDIFHETIDKNMDIFLEKLKQLSSLLKTVTMGESSKSYSVFGDRPNKRFVGKAFELSDKKKMEQYHQKVLHLLDSSINGTIRGGSATKRVDFALPSSYVFFMDQTGKMTDPIVYFRDHYWDVNMTNFHISVGTLSSASTLSNAFNHEFVKKCPIPLSVGATKLPLDKKIRLTVRNLPKNLMIRDSYDFDL